MRGIIQDLRRLKLLQDNTCETPEAVGIAKNILKRQHKETISRTEADDTVSVTLVVIVVSILIMPLWCIPGKAFVSHIALIYEL